MLLLPFADQVANGVAQLHAALAQCDPPAEIQNGDAIHFTGSYRKCHGKFLLVRYFGYSIFAAAGLRKTSAGRSARERRS